VVTGFGDARIGYVRLENHRGPAAARNAGIRQSKGRFLAFQDSDDEWLPAKLERHLGAFDMCAPEVGVVHSDMQRVLRDATARYHQSPTIVPNALIDPDTRFYQFRNLGIQSSVIKRECFEHVGVFNETFPALEDLELFIRLSKRYRFHHLREALVRYYETDGLSKNVPAKLAARKLLLKHYWRDLAKGHLAFVVREYSFLRRAERQCAAARWGGT